MRFAVVGCLVAVFATPARAQDPSPTDLDWLRGEVGDGALATWVRDQDKVHLTELSTGGTVEVGDGGYPEFSPDGSKLAWIDGTTAKGRMRKGDPTVHTIATGVTADAGIHWISDTEVALVRSGKWRRVSLSGSESEVPELTALGLGGTETDVKLCPDGVWAYVNGTTWKLSTGATGETGGSCSCSLSPAGDSVTGLEHAHKTCQLTRVRTGGHDGELQWVYDYTGDKGFDNHRYSSNHPDFVTCQDEKYNYLVIMKVGGTYCTRMGPQGSGEMYGDFTVGDGSGDPWPGTVQEPVLYLDPASLTFAAIEGGSNPGSRDIQVSNSGEGTLADVSVSENVGWLSVQRSGSGNSQTLTNLIDITGLTVGSYTEAVQVSCTNAVNSPRSYTVNLNVGDAPALTSISIQPVSTTIVAGQTADFTATPRDQNNAPFAAALAWGVSGGGSMAPDSSGGAVPEHTSTFTSDGAEGTFTVTASSGGIEGTATVSVESGASVHLRINCGENGFTPQGWEHDDSYVQGGTDFVFPDPFDTTGVADAAPPEVYRTCRHRIRDVETQYGYEVRSLPDGDYQVRLHFADAYGPRAIDVWIEGVEVLSDLDIVTDAGGSDKALVKEFDVTIADGDGLQIVLTDDRADPADFFVNGIEIISDGGAVNQPPTVDAGADQIVGLGVPVFLDGTVSDDGLPGGAVVTTWSLVSGPGDVTFTDAADPQTTANMDAAGDYTLRLTADDGALQAEDDVTITITGDPAIQILSPLSGDVLIAGSVHSIRWTTANLDDVQLDVSYDNGAHFDNIVGSVDSTKLEWGDYPWTVPDRPSEECIMLITGYYGEVPTQSGPFAIRRASDADGGSGPDEVQGACGCGPASASPGWALLVLLAWRRRRAA